MLDPTPISHTILNYNSSSERPVGRSKELNDYDFEKQCGGDTEDKVCSKESSEELNDLKDGDGVLNRLPVAKRREAAAQKYEKAVRLVAASNLPIRTIATLTNLSPTALSTHLIRHHRDLLMQRYGIPTTTEAIKSPKGQSQTSLVKYKAAIEACESPEFITFTIAEIARLFKLNPSALTSQLKVHYPDILPRREAARAAEGIVDNKQRGPRLTSSEQYAEAIRLYRDSDLTLQEVADKCDVSYGGLHQFLRFYHKDVLDAKERQRSAKRLHNTERQHNTKAAGAQTATADETDTKRYRKTAAEKYQKAIESLRDNLRPVTQVAKEFDLNPDVFRQYLKKHEPELHARLGMAVTEDGKSTRRTSQEKYREAIEEFRNSSMTDSPKTMKEIAERRGLVYKSLMSFMKRNYN